MHYLCVRQPAPLPHSQFFVDQHMTTPIRLGQNREATLRHAYASSGAMLTKDVAALTARKVADLGFYEVPAMDRAVAVCFWGRSGSFLLASYLDWHEDVIMLPEARSKWIYSFCEEYPFLPLREKLIAYPDFVALNTPEQPFFGGAFAINEVDYYAAIDALFEVYGGRSSEFLNSRHTFFVFLHVAYSLALGRRPASPRPLIVYAHHQTSLERARQFIEDFPNGRFIHAVRDPISTADSWTAACLRSPLILDTPEPGSSQYSNPSQWVLGGLAISDRPYAGMAARSRAVRFEDLHLKTAEIMDLVALWLELTASPTLTSSTFNGTEWLVGEGPASWSGARPEQARRHARNLFPFDRALVFALFYENFVRWGYPCPAVFARPWVRRAIAAAVWLMPMKAELLVAMRLGRRQLLPALRDGRVGFITHICLRLLLDGARVRKLLTAQIFRRVADRAKILTLLDRHDASPTLGTNDRYEAEH